MNLYKLIGPLAGGVLLWLAAGIAAAQTPIPKPVETALIGPGTVRIPGLGEVAGILAPDDVERYRRIFELQEDGRWADAATLVRRVRDDRLMGHVLAQKYLHPTKYRSRFTELRDWMAHYADHPQAQRIHRLAVIRQPTGARAPAPPVVNAPAVPNAEAYLASKGRPLYTRAASAEGRQLQSEIRRRVNRGWPTGAKEVLQRNRAQALLGREEQAQAWRDIARGYFHAGKDREAVDAANLSDAAAPDAAPLAYWWGGLAAWRLGRLEDAQSLFASLARSNNASDSLASAGAFWAARAFLVAGRPESVNALLEIGAHNPFTFYGQLSLRILGHDADIPWSLPPFTAAHFRDIAETGVGARAIALLQVGKSREAELELQSLAGARPALLPEILAFASHGNLPALALKLARFDDGETRHVASYPLPDWDPEDGFTIDKALVFAFVRQESAFNARAMSHAGARGLMQLMPRTASYIARERSLRGHGKYRLFDPDLNLALGQRYIAYLLDDENVGGNLFRLAAAYNAGPGNLRSWQRKIDTGDDPLLFIESLPSRETRLFVERILTNLWVYRHRMGQPVPSLDDIVAGRWPVYVAQDEVATTRARNGTD